MRLRPTKVKKRMDGLDIVFFQLKSGKARPPTKNDRRRLQQAIKIIRIGYDYADYRRNKVLFNWEPEEFLQSVKLV